jgi:RnfABCDGE-type electron transport complex G subunit
MRDIPRFAATLTLVACIAAGSLTWINQITKPRILIQQEEEVTNGLRHVLSGAENGVIVPIIKNGKTVYWEGFKDRKKNEFIGYAMQVPANGYQSTIQTLVGLDSLGTILRIKIIFQKETPGLGTQIETIRKGETAPWWQDQFSRKLATSVKVDKDKGEIVSISGATITSRSITNAIADSAKSLFNTIGKPLQN